jgi:Rod binding domain-containing protein
VQFSGAALQALSSQSTSGAAQTKDPRLERCAHEFEASLMTELLKPLQEGDGLTGEDSESGGSGSGGALSGFASESLAAAISQRGGFGIADRILHQLQSPNDGDPQKVQNQGSQSASSFSGRSR